MSSPLEVLQELQRQVVSEKTGAYLIEGPSLVGKTWILEELVKAIKPNSERLCVMQTCSSGLVGFEPVLAAVEAISKRKNWSRPKWRQSLLERHWKTAAFVTFGLAKKFFPDAIPDAIFDKLRDSLSSRAGAPADVSEVAEFPRSDISKLVQLLTKGIAASGKTLILLVDGIEDLPTPGVKLLQYLAEVRVEGFTLVLTANNESLAFFRRPDMRELANVYARRGDAVFVVNGYSVNELRELRWKRGRATSQAGTEAAFEYSLGGRVGLLGGWLDSEDETLAPLRADADRLAAHFAIQYDRLSAFAQELVKCLSVIYPNGLSLPVVASCLDCGIGDLERELRGLLNLFAKLSGQEVCLRNLHVLYFVRSRFTPALVQVAYSALQAKLVPSSPAPDAPKLTHSPPKLYASLPPSTVAMTPATLLDESKADLLRGASLSALTRIRAWREWSDGLGLPPQIETDVLLTEADAQGQLGQYEDAIRCLERVPGGPDSNVDVAISLAEKLLRIGQSDRALPHLRRARWIARKSGRAELWVKASARTLTIVKDTRRNDPSSRLASILAKYCSDAHSLAGHASVRCLGLRTAARTFALIPTEHERALALAREALRISFEETRALRDQGNCQYALADVLRHKAMFAEAEAAYSLALDVARSTSNYDLLIYSLLGTIAGRLTRLNSSTALLAITELKAALAPSSVEECALAELFDSIALRLSLKQARSLPDESSLSRPWAKALRKALDYSDEALRLTLVQTRIVL